jgi:excisionase family DNA binding protein
MVKSALIARNESLAKKVGRQSGNECQCRSRQDYSLTDEDLPNDGGWKLMSRSSPGLSTIAVGTILLTLDEAAARLSVSVDQLKKFVADGDLNFVNLGRGKKRPRYRFNPTDLDEFVASRTKREQPTCQSFERKSRVRTFGSTSGSTVVGFMAQRAARLGKRRSSSRG